MGRNWAAAEAAAAAATESELERCCNFFFVCVVLLAFSVGDERTFFKHTHKKRPVHLHVYNIRMKRHSNSTLITILSNAVLPSQQQHTLNKLPTELRRRSFLK